MPRAKESSIPHESDVEFEYQNAFELNDLRRLRSLVKKKWPLPKYSLWYVHSLRRRLRNNPMFEFLLKAGADPNYANGTLLLVGQCILESDIWKLKLLLRHGADPNRAFVGLPSIVLAARAGDIDVLRLLINSGASLFDDPRIAPNSLFEAVGRGHKEIVKFLIDRGVGFTSRRRFGKSALDFAKEKGMSEILDLLRHYKRQRSAPNKRMQRTRR